MIISQPAMEAMFQLRIVTVTVVKEICRISLVNKYSKALDSGEAREVHLSSHVATCHLFNSLTYWKAVWKEKRTLSISQIETVDKKANHEFSDKIVFFGGGGGWVGAEESVVLPIIAFIGSILKYWSCLHYLIWLLQSNFSRKEKEDN